MALVGNLRDLKLANLIQLNCMERNTVKLTIEFAGKYGFLYFQNGQVAHAEYDPDVGEDAFFKLLFLSEGYFKVENGVRPPMVSIKTHWNNLLLEGLHHVDSVEFSNKTPEQHTVSMLMNVKGVQNAAIIARNGDVIASSKEIDNEGALHALSYLETQKLTTSMIKGEPKYISIQELDYRVLLLRDKDVIAYLELDTKIQPETVSVFINKALS